MDECDETQVLYDDCSSDDKKYVIIYHKIIIYNKIIYIIHLW